MPQASAVGNSTVVRLQLVGISDVEVLDRCLHISDVRGEARFADELDKAVAENPVSLDPNLPKAIDSWSDSFGRDQTVVHCPNPFRVSNPSLTLRNLTPNSVSEKTALSDKSVGRL